MKGKIEFIDKTKDRSQSRRLDRIDICQKLIEAIRFAIEHEARKASAVISETAQTVRGFAGEFVDVSAQCIQEDGLKAYLSGLVEEAHTHFENEKKWKKTNPRK